MTKGAKITIAILCVLIALLIGGTVLLLTNREKPFLTPSSPTMISAGDKKFLNAPTVEGASKYLFRIDGVVYSSPVNVLDVSKIFTNSKEYVIELAIGGKNEKNNSAYSPSVKISNKIRLSKPTISYNQAAKMLSWSEIGENVSYKLFLNGVEHSELLKSTAFDCSALVGEISACVSVVPDQAQFIEESPKSENVTFSIEKKLEAPFNLEYDNATGLLKFEASEFSKTFEIEYNGLKILNIEPSKSDSSYIVDISLFCPLTETFVLKVKCKGYGFYLDSTNSLYN